MDRDQPITRPALTTPRAAAVAGIVFSLLLGLALVLIRLSTPADTARDLRYVKRAQAMTCRALNIVPFAGIAFLWFIGVIRDRIARTRIGSSRRSSWGAPLLFVAMLFVACADAGV
jgi:ABC-type amino acid transport system permease subunit